MTNVYTHFTPLDELDDAEEIQLYINALNIIPDELGVPDYMSWVPDNSEYPD